MAEPLTDEEPDEPLPPFDLSSRPDDIVVFADAGIQPLRRAHVRRSWFALRRSLAVVLARHELQLGVVLEPMGARLGENMEINRDRPAALVFRTIWPRDGKYYIQQVCFTTDVTTETIRLLVARIFFILTHGRAPEARVSNLSPHPIWREILRDRRQFPYMSFAVSWWDNPVQDDPLPLCVGVSMRPTSEDEMAQAHGHPFVLYRGE